MFGLQPFSNPLTPDFELLKLEIHAQYLLFLFTGSKNVGRTVLEGDSHLTTREARWLMLPRL